MALPNKYSLSRRQNVCSQTGAPFIDGQVIKTAIFLTPQEGQYTRHDYSEEGWSQYTGPEPYSTWSSTWEVSEKVRPESEQLFLDLYHAESEGEEKLLYILALILEREKVLKEVKDPQKKDKKVLCFRHLLTDERYEVAEVEIELEELVMIRSHLSSLMEGDSSHSEL